MLNSETAGARRSKPAPRKAMDSTVFFNCSHGQQGAPDVTGCRSQRVMFFCPTGPHPLAAAARRRCWTFAGCSFKAVMPTGFLTRPFSTGPSIHVQPRRGGGGGPVAGRAAVPVQVGPAISNSGLSCPFRLAVWVGQTKRHQMTSSVGRNMQDWGKEKGERYAPTL